MENFWVRKSVKKGVWAVLVRRRLEKTFLGWRGNDPGDLREGSHKILYGYTLYGNPHLMAQHDRVDHSLRPRVVVKKDEGFVQIRSLLGKPL